MWKLGSEKQNCLFFYDPRKSVIFLIFEKYLGKGYGA
jgi:hypothetical protein